MPLSDRPTLGWILLCCLLQGLLLQGCASAPSQGTNTQNSQPPNTDLQLMVTLPPAPPPLLDLRVRELAVDHELRLVAAWEMKSLGQRCVVFEVADAGKLERALRRLSGDWRVDLVQTVSTFRVQTGAPTATTAGTENNVGTANNVTDPVPDAYAHLQHSIKTLKLDGAQKLATGRGVSVAIIDTGIDFDHPDLRGRVAVAQNFVRHNPAFTTDIHGTAIAGVIAANVHNGLGILGVAPQAKLMALKACWQAQSDERQAVCDSYTLAQAIDFAIAQDAQVINLSLAGPEDPLLTKLLQTAAERQIFVVAAAAFDSNGKPSFPASLSSVLAVHSLGTDQPPPKAGELSAPGQEILTTMPRGVFDFMSGSSLAAAHVSGVGALILEHRPKLTAEAITQLLLKTARNNPGTAVVDACAALQQALGKTGGCES